MIHKYIFIALCFFIFQLHASNPPSTKITPSGDGPHVHYHFPQATAVTFVGANAQAMAQNVGIDPTPSAKRVTWSSIYEYCKNHKLRLFFIGSAGSYVILTAQLMRAKYHLAKQTWSNWKSSLSLKELLEKPQKQMAQELLTDIEKKYHADNTPDALMPLAQFVHDLTHEKNQLRSYVTLTTWITRLRLARIFPLCSTIAQQIQHKEERLAYVSSLFKSWTAEHPMPTVPSKKE